MPSYQPPKNIGQNVGAKIRSARLAKRYTQSQLAQPDFSVSYISAIERGQIQPSLRALEILANRLGLASTDLLSNSEKSDLSSTISSRITSNIEEAVELELLEAQLAIRRGLPLEALEQLHNLTSRNLNPRQLIRLKYLIGWAYANTPQLQESEYILTQAKQLIKDSDDALSLQILYILGTVYAALHNYAQALQAHQDAIEKIESTQPQNPFFLAQVYTNMGQHYSYLSKLDDAIGMFEQALAVAKDLLIPENLQSLYLRLVQDFSKAEEYHFASLNGYKSLHSSSQQSSFVLIGEIYHHLGKAMLKGDLEKAYTFLENALKEESVQQNQLALASVDTHMAGWLLLQHRMEEAENYAQQAYRLAEEFGNTLIAAEALLIQGHIAYAQQNFEAGDAHFESGLKMLEDLGAREEQIDHIVFYAELLEERGDPKKAFDYFRRAFEIRGRMTNHDGQP